MTNPSTKHIEKLLMQTGRAAKRFESRRPYTILCYAQSLDGSIGSSDRKPIALSCPESLRFAHQLRAMCDGILIGIGTVLSDDPKLTTRLVCGESPQPIVLDSQLRMPLDSGLLRENGKKPWIIASENACENKASALREAGARVFSIGMLDKEFLDLTSLLPLLKENGIECLMVEGGQRIISSFLHSGMLDELIVTIAPVFVRGLHVLSGDNDRVFEKLIIRERAQAGRDLILRLIPEERSK
ncbi:MAG: RibD family protein [Calditrichia bacterium]